MKKISTLILLVFLAVSISAQRSSISFNGVYWTKTEALGVGAQVMLPVYQNIYLAPNVEYLFGYDAKNMGKVVNATSLLYGIDLHYALEQNRLNISPFLGIGGVSEWVETRNLRLPWGENVSIGNSSIRMVGNIGVAARLLIDKNFFLNSQIKYKTDLSDDTFGLSIGLGYCF